MLKEYVQKHNTELFVGDNKFILELYAKILKEVKEELNEKR